MRVPLVTAVVQTPLGGLELTADDDALCKISWPRADSTTLAAPTSHPILAATICQLTEYFAGERRAFDLPLAPEGTTFQHRVWGALRQIPFGVTHSYGQLARAIAQPNASRAVGAANGQNPLAIIVPCHRVIGSNGALTGFAGGQAAKRWLLDHEARLVH